MDNTDSCLRRLQKNRHKITERWILRGFVAPILAFSFLLCSCGNAADPEITQGNVNVFNNGKPPAAEQKDIVYFEPELPNDQATDFKIESEFSNSVTFDSASNTYTIISAGTYDCYGSLYEGRLLIEAGQDDEVIINLNGCIITNSAEIPVCAVSAGKLEISAKKDTENKIYDLRSVADEESLGAAIYSACDLNIKGNGSLEVISNCNNGIHSKDDVKIKNLTLTVMAVNNAIKGNDSVTIESGVVTAISSGGDAVKTTATDLSKNGNQRGTVDISGGTVTLYAACDGIDSASDVNISGDAVLDIYTDKYSPYSGGIITGNSSTIYIQVDQSLYCAGYQYSAYFYKADGSYQWVNAVFKGQSGSSMFGGDMGGFGGGRGGFMDGGMDSMPGTAPDINGGGFDRNMGGNMPGGMPGDMGRNTSAIVGTADVNISGAAIVNAGMCGGRDGNMGGNKGGNMGGNMGGNRGGMGYYYYTVEKPAGFTDVIFYAYSSNQTQSQSENYAAVSSGDTSVPSGFDTFTVSGISGGSIQSSGWADYKTLTAGNSLAYSCKGIKAANSVFITGGNITIRSTDDGIHANKDNIMESTGSNGLGNVEISGGSVTITTSDDGIHGDQDVKISGGVINILTSYEGIEGNRIYISDGSVTVYATDDAINANSKGAYSAYIEISGGYVDAAVPNGDTDTLDSNGSILISGGLVFLKCGMMSGSSMAGGTIDSERGATVTGGTVIAIGCISEKISGSVYSTSQSMESGSYAIKDDSGKEIASFELTSTYKAVMLYSEHFESGKTYTVYKDSKSLLTFTK